MTNTGYGIGGIVTPDEMDLTKDYNFAGALQKSGNNIDAIPSAETIRVIIPIGRYGWAYSQSVYPVYAIYSYSYVFNKTEFVRTGYTTKIYFRALIWNTSAVETCYIRLYNLDFGGAGAGEVTGSAMSQLGSTRTVKTSDDIYANLPSGNAELRVEVASSSSAVGKEGYCGFAALIVDYVKD